LDNGIEKSCLGAKKKYEGSKTEEVMAKECSVDLREKVIAYRKRGRGKWKQQAYLD
jgi:hypothetical protein